MDKERVVKIAVVFSLAIFVLPMQVTASDTGLTGKLTSVFGGNSSETYTDPITGMEFIHVIGGCFKMGTAKESVGYRGNEGPMHKVCVDEYFLGKYEVTNEQYRQYRQTHIPKEYNGIAMNGDNQPVVYVSWDDAVAFAEWLSKRSGKSFRLPTEAEWEYAARAGSTTSKYWGDSVDTTCKYANVYDKSGKEKTDLSWAPHRCDDGFAVTAPVGEFKPNAWGFYDMLGNVWEWCSDWYEDFYYKQSPEENPKGPESGKQRVRRGGGWADMAEEIRPAVRNYSPQGFGFDALGFRLVMDVGTYK